MTPDRVETPSLYEQDFVLWLEAQATAVRDGRWSDLDAANVAEELEGLASADRREIRNRLIFLMVRLLNPIFTRSCYRALGDRPSVHKAR
jgi:hypothetical protein